MKRCRQMQLPLETAQKRKRESLRVWEAARICRRAGFRVFRAGAGECTIDGERHSVARLLALASHCPLWARG